VVAAGALQPVAAPARHPLGWCLLRVHAAADERVVGAGFVVGEDWVCTCAHVVAEALDVDARSPVAPAGEVPLQAYRDGRRLTGEVREVWVPARGEDDEGETNPHDIALLWAPGVGSALPAVRLVVPEALAGRRFDVCGFPGGEPAGVWAHGTLGQRRANQTVQVQGEGAGVRVQPGYSGAPVWDPRERGVVGMVVSAWRDAAAQAAFVIPVDALVAVAAGRLRATPSTRRPFEALSAGVSPRSPLVAFLTNYLGTPERPAPFGGRERELDQLDLWLGDAERPYRLVAASAGQGKSALLAHWALEVAANGRADVVMAPIACALVAISAPKSSGW
jgi:V8-like Glu-specific endopeptidase